ncbi:Putative phage gene, partial [Moritella viscosa]
MTMALEQKIILEVNDIELSFNVNVTAYNKFLNQSNQVNKIQP